ncbi:hypothetical protein HPB47_013745 [Ixodes persulcatus]|uniref:Uncharacterized protein n=1 Tax=Ixodes persulcatus TaxID=34615 RepID=A0AC60QYM2_IXOPE|nr:hypothetical protein HPB47_013745 [Ixodes persulcatus]
MKLMRKRDHRFFKKFYRMDPASFNTLQELVQADSQRMYCIPRSYADGDGDGDADTTQAGNRRLRAVL